MGYFRDKYGSKTIPAQENQSVQPIQYEQKQSRIGVGDIVKEVPGAVAKIGKGLANFFTQSEQNLGKSLGQSLFVMTGGKKKIDEITKQNMDTGDAMLKLANQQTDIKRKVNYINQANEAYKAAGSTSEDVMGHIRSNKQILGDSAGVLLDALSFGTYGKAATAMKSGQLSKAMPTVLGASKKIPTTFGKGFMEGAKSSAKISTPIGAAYGVSQGMQDDKNLGGIVKSGVIGGVSGLGLGSLLGGVTGGLSAKANVNKITEKAQNVGTYTGGVTVPKSQRQILDNMVLDESLAKNKLRDIAGKVDKILGKKISVGVAQTELSNKILKVNTKKIDSAGQFFDEVAKIIKSDPNYKPAMLGDSGLKSTIQDIFLLEKNGINVYTPAKEIGTNKNVDAIQALQTKKPSLLSSQPQLTPKEFPMQSGLVSGQKLQLPSSKSSYTGNLAQNGKTVNNVKSAILNNKLRQRGFASSVQEAQNISGKTKVNVSGGYVPKSNDTLMGEAKALLVEGVKVDLNKVQNADKKIAAAMQEAINLDKLGNHEPAANLYNNISKALTEHGRAIQAASMLDKMSPEAISLSAAGNIRRFNLTAKVKIPELTGTQQEFISNSIKKIQSVPVGRERNLLINKLDNSLKDFIPSTFVDKAITAWKAGLLSSLRTHERNIIGNTVHGIAEVVKDAPAALNDIIISSLKRTPRSKSFTLKTGGGIKKGIQSSKDMLLHGFDPEQTMRKLDIGKHTTWANTPIQQGLKKATNIIFRSLGAEDKIFYHTAFGHSLQEQANTAAINAGKRGNKTFINNLIKNATDDMKSIATNDAATAVFQNKNILRDLASSAKRTLSKNEYAKFAGDFLMPFTGVPSSIAGQLVAYSPIGLTQGLINDAKVLFSKSANPVLQRAAAQQAGRGTIGIAILAAGAYLAKKGLISGEPKDETETRQWELEGKPRNSIMLLGKWRSINSVGPEAIILLAGGEWSRQNKGKGNPFTDKVLNTGGYLGKAFTNQTFLSGIQQPLAVLTDPVKNKPSRFVGSELGSFIPNIVKDTAKVFDPYQRESNGIMDTIQSSIPFLRNKLLPKRDVLGKIIPNQLTGVLPFVDLFNSQKPVDNPVVNELKRLYDMGLSATPSKLSPNQTLLGQKIILNPQLLDQLESQSGGKISFVLDKLVTSKEYQMASDETKKKYIDTIVDAVRKGTKQNQLMPILQNALKK
jgi:hypothetical protein